MKLDDSLPSPPSSKPPPSAPSSAPKSSPPPLGPSSSHPGSSTTLILVHLYLLVSTPPISLTLELPKTKAPLTLLPTLILPPSNPLTPPRFIVNRGRAITPWLRYLLSLLSIRSSPAPRSTAQPLTRPAPTLFLQFSTAAPSITDFLWSPQSFSFVIPNRENSSERLVGALCNQFLKCFFIYLKMYMEVDIKR